MVTLNTEAALIAPEGDADERGFGVIEIVVSMFLLLIIAAAFLPLMIQGYKLSVLNATVATATQLANQQVERVRGAGAAPNCTAIFTALNNPPAAAPATSPATTVDQKLHRGYMLQTSGVVQIKRADGKWIPLTNCAAVPSYPTVFRLTATATEVAAPSGPAPVASAAPLAEIKTLIFVKAA